MTAERITPEFWFAAAWASFSAACIVLSGLGKISLGDAVLAALAGSVAIPTAARAFAAVLKRQ